MLASDYTTLSPAMQAGVRRFFEHNRDWLINVLQRGLRERELDYAGPTADVADFIVASLEGAMLTCWVDGGEARFARISQQLLAALSVCADA